MSYEDNATRLFIIGSHASHTMSSDLWNPVFEELGNCWTYQPWDVPAQGEMQDVRNGLLAADVIGANVTMPHKQWAAAIADERSEQVSLSGAANLLIRQDDQLSAYNTDLIAVETGLATKSHDHVLLLGAGGAARAALVALKGRIGTIIITDRHRDVAEELLTLAKGMGIPGRTVDFSQVAEAATQATLIINATPIGKDPKDPAPWGKARLRPGTFVYDFVYCEHVTGTILSAIDQGLEYSDGWEHLLLQAEAMIPLLGLGEQTAAQLRLSLKRIRDSY
ncbi:shikimate dehydrogenase [Glutamicibacter sp. JL.03c]|uniref:shikimate dehydrogenase family protein n=1 Tax=Glutamicibacter sp. JL.03c TaxID=2984842 RepID=UPI0021F7D9DF|nr:shikimate dehydrogenase [Glutamicibacter sp. JL.03c]UYQ77883.1 shikimate dehydrogenase [Glutamicibacter sp. JL.03c]